MYIAKSVDSIGTASIEVVKQIVLDEWQATCRFFSDSSCSMSWPSVSTELDCQ